MQDKFTILAPTSQAASRSMRAAPMGNPRNLCTLRVSFHRLLPENFDRLAGRAFGAPPAKKKRKDGTFSRLALLSGRKMKTSTIDPLLSREPLVRAAVQYY